MQLWESHYDPFHPFLIKGNTRIYELFLHNDVKYNLFALNEFDCNFHFVLREATIRVHPMRPG